MKQILIDISSLANELRRKRPPHGIPRVTLAYISHYLNSMQVLFRTSKRVYILPHDISRQIAVLLLGWNFNHFGAILRLIIKGCLKSIRVKHHTEYYLIKTDHGGFKNPGYIKALNEKGIKMIAIVHDLIPVVNPEFSTAAGTSKFAKSLTTILNNAKGIIAVSNSTRETLKDYVAATNDKCPPVITATLAPGVSSELSMQKRLIEGAYFVTVSTIGDRKNHLLLLQVWRNLVERWGTNAPKLVIVGKRTTHCSYTLSMLDRCDQLKGVVIESKCSDKELVNYLQHAQALLFPTFTEGYGLPLIEALSVGLPVIASNLAVFREIAGDIPEYFDPIDGLGWMQCIENYTPENSPMREAQILRMKNFQVPVWEDHFAKVDAFIEAIK